MIAAIKMQRGNTILFNPTAILLSLGETSTLPGPSALLPQQALAMFQQELESNLV